MNLQSMYKLVAGLGAKAKKITGFFGQIQIGGVFSPRPMTYSAIASVRSKFLALAIPLVACLVPALSSSAQTNYYHANGTEYAIAGSLPGDQVYPDVAISTTGGY